MAAARGAQLDPATAAKLSQLRTTNRRQAQERDILKKPCHVLCDRQPRNRCRFIEAQHAHYPVRFLCHVLGVSANG